MINEIKKEIDRFFDMNLDEKYKKLCYRIFDDFVKFNEDELNDDSEKIWAGGFVYATCQINLLFNTAFKDSISYEDICNFFSESKQTLLKKGIHIRKVLNANLLDERYTTKEAIQRSPKIDYSEIDDELDIIYSNGKQVIFDQRETSHSYFNKQTSKHSLDRTIFYGSEYPDSAYDYDTYSILETLKDEPDIDKAFNMIDLKTDDSKDLLKNKLENEELIEPLPLDKENLDKLSANELSDILKDNGITASGKKKKLLKLVKANLNEITGKEYLITQKGLDFIDESEWVNLTRLALNKFDYNDYSRYLDENEDLNLIENTLNYIEKHIYLAIENEDFGYLSDCYYAIGQVYYYDMKVEESRKWHIRNLILRMNPIYDYKTYYHDELIITQDIAAVLKITDKLSKTTMTEELFKEIWDEMEIEKEFISVNECYEWYMKIINTSEEYLGISNDYYNQRLN